MHILVIEDNKRILDNITYILKSENYLVDSATDGEEGYQKAQDSMYDCIVLDIMLPGMDGFEILESLRANGIRIPILVLSARGQVEDKVRALDLGSDDYLTKPFASAELLARIRTLLRRQSGTASNAILVGPLTIDTAAREVRINSTSLQLTSKEYELLEFLAYNRDKVVSRIAIGEHIWGESLDLFTMSNFIDVHVKNLRKKIEDHHKGKLIHTRRGVGFILTDRDES
jgi:DNA-binding response OmpR family regulator